MQRILFADGITIREISGTWAERFDTKAIDDDHFLVAIGSDGAETYLSGDFDLLDRGCSDTITCEETIKKRLALLAHLALEGLVDKIKSGQELIEITQIVNEANERLIRSQVERLLDGGLDKYLRQIVSQEIQKAGPKSSLFGGFQNKEQTRWIVGPSWML